MSWTPIQDCVVRLAEVLSDVRMRGACADQTVVMGTPNDDIATNDFEKFSTNLTN